MPTGCQPELFPETSRAAAYVTTFLANPAPKVTWRFGTRVFFDIDIDHCQNCGGSLKIIAAPSTRLRTGIEDPLVIVRILTHLGLPTAPRRARRRSESIYSKRLESRKRLANASRRRRSL